LNRIDFKKYVKVAIFSVILAILIFVVGLIIFKYEIEGENKEELPYFIEKISIVSTADGIKNEENTEYLWNGEIIQVNDVYIKVAKNESTNSIIENVIIENLVVTNPIKGNLNFSRIIKNEDTSNNYIVEQLKEYRYTGTQTTSLNELTIANNGGNIGLRIINNGLGTYSSNEEEINYDGRILSIENILNEDIKFKVNFDVLIEVLDGIKYKTNVELELPIGNIIENGVEIKEIQDLENLIYKRY